MKKTCCFTGHRKIPPVLQKMRVLSREEQKQFTEYLLTDMDNIKFGVLLTLMTGLRIGEICALRWSDISLNEKIIRVGATMQRIKKLYLPLLCPVV